MKNPRLILWILAIGVAAALLRGVIATRSNLWADEIFSVAVVSGHSLEHPAAVADPARGDYVDAPHPRPAAELRRYLQHEDPPAGMARVLRAVELSETSPPLYYVFLYAWTLVAGTGDLAVRLFSITWALACLPLLVMLARRVGGGRAVLGSCVLFAFSPMGVYYSVEARMYSQLWFLVLALMVLTLHLQQRGAGGWRGIAWVAVGAAGFLTHYFFVFPFAAAGLYLLLQPGRLARGVVLAVGLAAGLLVLPWYLKLPESLAAWRITNGWLEWPPANFERIAAIRDLVLHFFTGESFYLWRLHHRWNAVGAMLFALIALAALLRLRTRWFQGRRLLVWLWFLAVCAGPIVFDGLKGTYTVAVPRYVTAALPAAFLLAGIALGCLSQRAQTAVLALILIAWTPTLGAIFRKAGRSGPEIKRIAHDVSAEATAADVVLVHSIPSGVLAFARYAEGPAPIASWVGQLGQRVVPDSLLALARDRERIFFLRYHEVGAAAPEEDWLRAHANVLREEQYGGTRVTVFGPREGRTF